MRELRKAREALTTAARLLATVVKAMDVFRGETSQGARGRRAFTLYDAGYDAILLSRRHGGEPVVLELTHTDGPHEVWTPLAVGEKEVRKLCKVRQVHDYETRFRFRDMTKTE